MGLDIPLDGVRIAAGGFTNRRAINGIIIPTSRINLAAKLRLFRDLVRANGAA